ncbi:CBS domain-containing protein [Amaricoccus macauensis]|uniref:CBS domain-containing protein n=1 Tax=Amaricoccus macauensis TaxID=57001 RepID=UPI003C7DDBB6
MQIKDVMSNHPVTVAPEQTLAEAAEIMRRIDTGFIPVGENDRLIGTITDRDIVINGLAQGKAADSAVRDAMSSDLYYCYQDQDVGEVARNMGEQQIRRMPVVDREKKLVGIVSLGDLSTEGAASAAGAALELISE